MKRTGLRLMAVLACIFIGLVILFVVNQTAQFVGLFDRISPTLGTVVLWILIALYALCIIATILFFVRLPKTIRPPESTDSPEFPKYVDTLLKRFEKNPHLAGYHLETRDDLEKALDVLGEKSDDVIRDSALQVFLMTSISQNGSLDGIAVIAAQFRMINRVARIYNQRPTLRDMLFLYGNVAMAALLARQIEDIDFNEYIQPVVSAITSSFAGLIPGMQSLTTVVIHSMLTGSTNAYMTLRVGVVAKLYCGSLAIPSRSVMRRMAFVQAAQMIPGIVNEGAKKTSRIIFAAAYGTAKSATKATVDTAKSATKATVDTARSATKATVYTVKSATKATLDSAIAAARKTTDTAKSATKTTTETVGTMTQKAASTVIEKGKKTAEFLKDIAEGTLRSTGALVSRSRINKPKYRLRRTISRQHKPANPGGETDA